MRTEELMWVKWEVKYRESHVLGLVGGKLQRKSHPGLVVCYFLLPVVIKSVIGTLEVASWRILLFLPVLLASPSPTPALP